MKKHLLSMLLATIWLCSLAQIPTNGLVQRFSFDGTLDGINGNSLSLFGQANYVNDRFSNANSAQNLTTTNNSFNTASLTNLPTGNTDRTVSFWYKSNANATHSLFNYGNNNGANTFAIAYTTGPTRLVLFDGANEYSRNISYTGTWTHVAVVHSAGNSYIYLNGTQQGAAIPVTYSTSAGQTVNIGFSPGNSPYANFQMDELLVYNRALSSGEIVGLYNACGNPTNTTTAANQNICTGGTATLSVVGSNVSWYTTPSGGSVIAAGNSYTTGALSANTNYYAASAGCVVRTEIPVTVTQAAPTAPTNTSQAAYLTRCSGATSILSVSSTDSVRWYNVPTGGTALGTGNSFTTPAHADPFPNATGTVTYYAEAWNACGASARTAINITVKATPATPVNTTSAGNLNICTGGSTTLTVSSTSGNVEWSTVSVTPTTVATGNTYTTPVLTETTQYAVYSILNGCFSNEVIITVNVSQSSTAAPTNSTSAAALSVCEGNTTSLSATSSGSTIYWYDAPTGGNLLGTGSPFTTPAINANTTFYAQAGTGSCASSRTAIAVTLKFAPTGVIELVNDTIRASNLYNSFVLRKDSTIIASSNSTGSFAIPATECGDYQATFTNPTNNCPNVSVSVSKAYISAEFYCEARVTLSGVTFPVTYSMNYSPVYTTPTLIDNAAPLNFRLTTNLTTCSAVSGMRYVSFKTGTGCVYNFAFDAELPFGTYNTSVASISDSVTTCPFTSNILTVNTINIPAPANTTAAAALSICNGSTTTLTASGSGTLYWFDQATGGTVLGTGTSFSTTALTTNKTYYVQSGNSTCASPRTSIQVTVNTIPTASINPTTATTCAGQGIQLTATGGGSYSWSNNLGSNATVTVSPTANATYSVTVTGSGNCTASATRSVTVYTVPSATISPSATSICSGGSITLTANGGGTYAWSNNLGTSAAVTASPTSNTTYTVTVTGQGNCTATASYIVTVNNVTASINGPTTICSGLQATLTADGGTSYAWSNSLGTTAAVTVSPTSNTTYTVTVTGVGNCTATASQTVSVQNAPTVAITGNTTICSGESATLTANGGNTYTWGNGLGSNAAITVNPTSHTTYTVTVSIGANCTATATETVTVNQPSASSFSQTVCNGESFSFGGNTLTAGGVYYDTLQNVTGCDSIVTLTFNVLPLATATINATICTNQSYEFDGMQLTQEGQYFDTLQTQAGCDSFVVLNLNVASQLTSSYSAAICQGESYDFNGQALTTSDVYTATLTSTGGCDSVVTLTLTVNALPVPSIAANGNVLSTQSFDSYQWMLEANEIQGANGQTYTAVENGNYTVWVSDDNGCEAVSSVVAVTGVGIKGISQAAIKVYPNPAEDVLVVEMPAIDLTKLTITDMEGRILMEQYVSGKQTLDISSLPAGVLNMQFNTSTGIATSKLVKLK